MPSLGEINLGSQVAKTTAVRIALTAFGFVGTIIFARVLGPTDFGGYYLLLTVVQLANRPFKGWTAGVEKRYSEDDADREAFLGAGLLFTLLGLAALAPVAFLLEGRLAAFTGLGGPALLFLLLLAGEVLFQQLDQLAAAEGRIAVTNYVDGLRSVLTLGLQLLLVAVGLGVAGMAFGLAGATAVAIAVNFYVVGRVPSLPSREAVRSVARFARYAVPTSIVGKAYGRLDTLLLGLVLTPAAAGEYEVALKLTIPAILVSNAIQQALFPKISNRHSRGEAIADDVANAKRFASVLAIPLFFGALALSERVVVTVYGPDYRGAAILLIGLALYRVVNTQTQIHVRTLEAVDRPRAVLQASTIALAVNVPLGYALLVEYGAVGVVAATVVAESIRYAIVVIRTRGVAAVGVVTGELPRQVAAAAVMYVAVVALASIVGEWSWLALLAVVGVGAAVYAAVLVAISRRLRVTARGILDDLAEEGLA